MNHTITIGGLIWTVGALIGLGGSGLGLLMIFAGGMSDAPSAGDSTSSSGCLVLLGSGLLLVGCVMKLLA